MSAQVPTSSSTDAIPVTPTRFLFATSRVSSVLDKPAMSSGVSNNANPSIIRSVSGFQPMVTSHYSAARFKTAGQDYTCTVASAGPANVWRPPPAPLPSSENLLAMIATTMEKMNADRSLPAMQVLKFDGSPENYLVFRQRFHQMVESKALDKPTKMARLIQFLEGPALLAVQRYESVPGGLTKALQVLQDRFGQPFKVVRACVDALIKGPVIAPQDRHGLRRYADTAQVMYDTLESMDCLGEMNTDNLEKMILRLPKWAQTKFCEHLKNLERQQGHVMPTFKDVVNFLNDRADVANHPFFSNPVSEMKTMNSKTTALKFTSLATEGATDQIENGNAVKHAKKTGKCLMCTRSNPLYRCETFKSKPVNERHEFIKRSRICFNCNNSVEHSSRSCKSSVHCQKPECGKRHHTLLHFASFNPERNDVHQANHIENAAIHDVPVARPLQADLPVPLSGCATATMVRPSEILLQIVPLKIIGNNGTTVTTYGLIDSGSDVTMIDPSLVEKLEIQGESSQLLLSTVNERDKRQQGLKVDFKIASIDDQDFREVAVCDAWAVQDLSIPLKHLAIRTKRDLWPHLSQVPFPEVERNKVSVLIGTNVQEAFIPLEVKKGEPNEPFTIRSCLGWSILGGSVECGKKHQFNLNHVSCEEISLSHQVEDFWRVLKSVPNEGRAIWLAQQLILLLKKGGFHLTKFSSNSCKFLAKLPEKERANPDLNLDLYDLPIGRVLRLHWDANSDTFQFKVRPTDKPPTKRGILSTVSSLFDPLGFLSPFILPMKILLQELWRIGVQWDESIPEPLLTQWRKWTESLSSVSDIKIPKWFRCSFLAAITDIQFITFQTHLSMGTLPLLTLDSSMIKEEFIARSSLGKRATHL